MAHKSDGPGVAVTCIFLGCVVTPGYFWRLRFASYQEVLLVIPGILLLAKGLIDLIIEIRSSLRRQ